MESAPGGLLQAHCITAPANASHFYNFIINNQHVMVLPILSLLLHLHKNAGQAGRRHGDVAL
jgi:hypothetical protein